MVSLYRKWRSSSFADLIGQPHVVRTLRNAVQHGRVAHAYLFTGPRGTGKTSTARILAKAVNCQRPENGDPCNSCAMCMAANEGRAVDVIEIDAASNTSVDNVRELRERVGYAAGEGAFKVYIVDEVHRLSAAAFDAFLKTLEEPPPHVIFIFASTEPHKVPETITSRCQRIDFHRIGPQDTFARLRYIADHEPVPATDAALQLIASLAQGSLRDALGLLDQVAAHCDGSIEESDVRSALGLADAALVTSLADCLLSQQIGRGLEAFQRFVADGGDPRQLMRQFVDHWRSILLTASGAPLPGSTVGTDAVPQQAVVVQPKTALAVLRSLTAGDISPRFTLPSEISFELAYVEAALAIQPEKPMPESVTRMEIVARPRETRDEDRSIPTAPAKEEPSDALPSPPEAATRPNVPNGTVAGSWPAVVAGMRAHSRTLQALLNSAGVLREGDGEVVLGVKYEFHLGQLNDTRQRRLIEQVIHEVVGVSVKVSCVRATTDELRAIGKDDGEDDETFVRDVEERLRQFHARELGNGSV